MQRRAKDKFLMIVLIYQRKKKKEKKKLRYALFEFIGLRAHSASR